jgi:hypothetical protein
MEPTMEAGVGPASGSTPAVGPVVQIDECAYMDELVRAMAHQTLSPLSVMAFASACSRSLQLLLLFRCDREESKPIPRVHHLTP